jgi:hypothetical protein
MAPERSPITLVVRPVEAAQIDSPGRAANEPAMSARASASTTTPG